MTSESHAEKTSYEEAKEFVESWQKRINEFIESFLPQARVLEAGPELGYPSETLAALNKISSDCKVKMVLFQYEPWISKGDKAKAQQQQGFIRGVLSRDIDSLIVQVYAKMAGLQIATDTRSEPQMSPHGKMPFAVVSVGSMYNVLSNRNEILEHLKLNGVDLDAHLSEAERGEALACISMVESSIRPALLFYLFANTLNYSYFTKYLYYNENTDWFFVRHKKSKDKRREAIGYLEKSQQHGIMGSAPVLSRSDIDTQYRNALKNLQTLLSKNSYKFFLDTKACSLDVFVFSYLDLIYVFGDSYKEKGTMGSKDQSSDIYDFMVDSKLKAILVEHDALLQWYLRTKSEFNL